MKTCCNRPILAPPIHLGTEPYYSRLARGFSANCETVRIQPDPQEGLVPREIGQIEKVRVARRMTGDLGGECGRKDEFVRDPDIVPRTGIERIPQGVEPET